jgi:FAD/FMN-containing dehydrogenase
MFKRIPLFAVLLLECFAYVPYSYSQDRGAEAGSKPIVNDVSQLNPIEVERIVVPHTVSEIIEAVKGAKGPVSIGGGRYSMGGQTATEGAVQLDMREFNKIISFSPEKKEVTVESGVTWRQLQEFIDPHNLSVKIMQTYSNFTVGGSLSVNVHGRYIGYGPLVLSIKRIGVVLADGTYVNASPSENTEIFYGAIGGYGGIGVIVDSTLELADNIKVRRVSKVMPFSEYEDYFFREIRDNPKAIFHNADIYPDSYDTVRATTYEETDLPVTREQRLIPQDQSYSLERMLMGIVSEAPGGKAFRRYVVDPIMFYGDRVTWRNYEASYTVLELEPTSRRDSTYVLQEYFVPVENINEFVPGMAKVLNDNQVNVINISIRHAKQDPGTLLAWARQEVFAFVLYYKQGTGAEEQGRVGAWTRQLIDAALASGGRYYLPYQIHATEKQFKEAYPGFEKFFALKMRVDPANKFRNKLWDAYYPQNDSVTK